MTALHTWYKKPKTYERVQKVTEDTEKVRTITTITEDKLLDKELKIPISPYIHPKGLQELVARGNKAAVIVMYILVSGLRMREQHNIVTISQEELASYCKISLKAVNLALQFLIANEYLEKSGKQVYKISPKIAWFGNQVDWALALKDILPIK